MSAMRFPYDLEVRALAVVALHEVARELPSLSISSPTGPENSKGALTARG